MVNLILNYSLKRIVDQPRPPTSDRSGPGMPSDHAQLSFFLAVYTALWLASGRVTILSPSLDGPRRLRNSRLLTAVQGIGIVLAALVAWSRVRLGYHTTAQVCAGALVGAATARAWWGLTEAWIRPNIFPAVEASVWAQTLCAKDSSSVQDVLRVEYDASRSARRRSHARKDGGPEVARKEQRWT
jgi:dolichyldiphosphatase